MNDEGLSDDSHRVEGFPVEDLVEEVLLQDHAERLVNAAAAADQELLMLTLANGAQDFLVGIVCIDPVNLNARRHNVRDIVIADVEHPLDDLLLGPMEKTRPLAFGDKQPQLLG